jgi:large subunit ribosomal protein L6
MSRIGRQPIPVPAGVTVSIETESVRVNGPKGELSERVHKDIAVTQDGDQLVVTRPPTAANTARCTGSHARSWRTWCRA